MDMRYAGEVHEVTVPVRSRTHRITALNIEATLSDFHALHERLYAHMDRAQPVELLTLRLELVGVRERPRIPRRRSKARMPATPARASAPSTSRP